MTLDSAEACKCCYGNLFVTAHSVIIGRTGNSSQNLVPTKYTLFIRLLYILPLVCHYLGASDNFLEKYIKTQHCICRILDNGPGGPKHVGD